MRLAGQLINVILITATPLLAALAVGMALTMHSGADQAGQTLAERLTANGEQAAGQAEKRLEERGRSLAKIVAQVSPSFVVSDDLTTLEAMAAREAAPPMWKVRIVS